MRARYALIVLGLIGAAAALTAALLRRRTADAVVADTAEPPRERVVSERELDGLTRAELYERARDADLPGRSKMSKAELRAALASSA